MSLRSCLALSIAMLLPLAAQADLTTYTQNFNGMNTADSGLGPTDLADDGWLAGANVFDAAGNFQYNYFSFPAPNGGPAFSAVATGNGGPNQAPNYVNIYSDYNNGDHGNGLYIDALVFQEQTIGTDDLGTTATFTFDYLKNPDASANFADTTTFAWVKVLDSLGGSFATLGVTEFETTAASTTTWAEGQSIDLAIDSAWDGQLLQFGFRSYATGFNDSGIFYDNLTFSNASAIPEPASAMLIGLGCVGFGLRRRRK